jgi:hypothetical protein
MAQTLENALRVKQKTLDFTRKPAQQSLLRTLFSHLAQHKGNPDLQFVPISGLETADVVLSDVPGRLYAVLVRKPVASTVDAWFKVSDHASAAAAAADFAAKLVGTGGGGQEVLLVFPDGVILATGATAGSHTAVGGSSKSLVANAPVGFAIVGA